MVSQSARSSDLAKLGGERVAIIAGDGKLPNILAAHLNETGREPYVFLLNGNADPALTIYEHSHVSTAQIGAIVASLRKHNIKILTMIGGVKGRPTWRDYRLDWTTIKLFAGFAKSVKQGDDNLLRHVIATLESEGIAVVGAHELMPSLASIAGPISGKVPTNPQIQSIKVGVAAARQLGLLDIGQACVVIGQRVVALEGAEGTDEMLLRVAALRKAGKIKAKSGGVLIKTCKPQQDKRADLPTIGVSTVKNAHAAGLKGIAIDAGKSIIVDVMDTCAEADKLNIFIYGFTDEY